MSSIFNHTNLTTIGTTLAESEIPPLRYIVAGAAIVVFSGLQYWNLRKYDIDLPAIGPSGRLTSYYGAIKCIFNAKEMFEEGIAKYGGRPFKYPELGRWTVLISSPELIEEVRKAPDSKLSFLEALIDFLAVPWTMGSEVGRNPYHIHTIKSQLTRNLGVLFDDIRDEVEHAFGELIPAVTDDWLAVPAFDMVMKVVTRATNRTFVGLPLCRNEDWCALNMNFTVDVVKGSATLKLFPDFLKPLVGEFLTSVPNNMRRGVRLLGPTIEYRLRQREEHGKDWPGKPADALSWLIEDAPAEECNVQDLTRRILVMNFAAVHTSTMSFTHALLHLAARPQYIQPLREEVESIMKDEGWTKASTSKMHKLDSFLKEAQRLTGLGITTMVRKALVDQTLSDGTFIPAGTYISIYSQSAMVHLDEKTYPNAHEFDGFRFANMHDDDDKGLEGSQQQYVSTSLSYLPFGHGRHACPGRFFAGNELKLMLGCIVLMYDIKLENEGVRPADMKFGTNTIPNTTAKVLFRKRST